MKKINGMTHWIIWLGPVLTDGSPSMVITYLKVTLSVTWPPATL